MAKPPKKPIGEWRSVLMDHPDYVSAIGMISIENANLEIALADVLAAVLGTRAEVGRAIFFTPRAAILRVDILEAAAKSRLRPKKEGDQFWENEPGKADALKRVLGIVANAKSAIGRRHAVIHDAWGTDDATGDVTRESLPLSGAAKVEELSALNNLVRDIRGTIYKAKALASSLRKRPPTLIDLRITPPDKTP